MQEMVSTILAFIFLSKKTGKIRREGSKMKKKWEVRYFVTAVASVPIYKNYGKTDAYRQAAKRARR